MWRWIRNAFILFSLLVFVAGSVMWVRSLSVTDIIDAEREGYRFVIVSMDQRLVVGGGEYIDHWPHPVMESWHWDYRSQDHKPIERHFDFDFFDRKGTRYFHILGAFYVEQGLISSGTNDTGIALLMIAIPFWFIVPLSAMPPLWWLFRGRQRSKAYRRKRGLCVGCGYDLRGKRKACPECGVSAAGQVYE